MKDDRENRLLWQLTVLCRQLGEATVPDRGEGDNPLIMNSQRILGDLGHTREWTPRAVCGTLASHVAHPRQTTLTQSGLALNPARRLDVKLLSPHSEVADLTIRFT